MNAASLSSVTAWTVVQLRVPGQMHTFTDDWRYTQAAPQVIVAAQPGGFFSALDGRDQSDGRTGNAPEERGVQEYRGYS
jgi:hypothetical protein